jgi:hypothetical protein
MSNIEKVQNMIRGIHARKIQVGAEPKTIHQRKEGEKWVDANGREWIKENGKRKQLTKVPPIGLDKCNDCENLILKTIDRHTYNRMGRCKYCQINFEADLKLEGKWEDWVNEMEEKRWEAVLKEYEIEMDEISKTKTPFDKTIANALANHEHRK